MIPKKQLSLLNYKDNIYDYPQSTIDAQVVDDYDKTSIIQMMKLHLRRSNHFSADILSKKIDMDFKDADFVRLYKYPLPATYNVRTGKVIINLHALGKKEVTNIDPKSLHAIIFYGYLCKAFTKRPLPVSEAMDVANFLSEHLMFMFGKQFGIMASYGDMIPKLRFLTIAYTYTSLFDQPQIKTYNRASASGASQKDFPHLDVDKYDLTDTRNFIKILSDSSVFPGLDIGVFVSRIINRYGLIMLPFFEDEMRFMATIGAASMPSGEIFPPYLESINRKIYNKLIMLIQSLTT
jgi:hypothetical protein